VPRNPRYDVLFEPVRIGPVTAKNRFYQVPHCSGMGYALPQTLAAMREVKAEGGWGVVCTEYCSIHPTSDDGGYAYATLWDDDDVKAQALMTAAVHRHGALAGVELWHGGHHAVNRYSREAPLSPSGLPLHFVHPLQTRAMDKGDIRDLRRWQVAAAKRAQTAGFDIVYVYAGHGYLPFQFIARRCNQRGDEYGGSLENRVRLLREMIEETKAAVGDRCAVAVRLAVDELMGPEGVSAEAEGREIVAMLAELPDLWDVNISDVDNDSMSARFSEEAHQARYVGFVKQLTSKPVVGVGRFTSPDAMVGQIRKGVLDFIGAARPSIADPFLPRKIDEGREEEIRECIGCNICRSGNNEGVPIRCTQNPTMGEEWRRGWHPERIAPARSPARILIVGAGPAGLECAVALGRRGHAVALAEAGIELGGRVTRESRLPGLSSWARVRDYRLGQLQRLTNVEIFPASPLAAAHVLELGFDHVVVATGATWRRDGVGYRHHHPIAGLGHPHIVTPGDVMNGIAVGGPVVIFDDDHYYMGGVLAEKLRRDGHMVTLATPAAEASTWTRMTDEQAKVQAQLIRLGVELLPFHDLAGAEGASAILEHVHTGQRQARPCGTLLLVTSRLPNDALYHQLQSDPAALVAAGIKSVTRIGDCFVPGAIVHAVYGGHRFARALDETPSGDVPFRRERVVP
jgi:dimethylamine/trimethylamine dehydrogenase